MTVTEEAWTVHGVLSAQAHRYGGRLTHAKFVGAPVSACGRFLGAELGAALLDVAPECAVCMRVLGPYTSWRHDGDDPAPLCTRCRASFAVDGRLCAACDAEVHKAVTDWQDESQPSPQERPAA